MAVVADKLVTAEEYAAMPGPAGGAREELVRGVVVKMPQPGFQHGKRQVRLLAKLLHFVDANRLGHVTAESGVRTSRAPDTVRGPDVAFWSAARIPLDEEPVGYPDVAADLVAEIRSPHETPGDIEDKVLEYLDAGVRMVWIVNPRNRRVTVYRSRDRIRMLEAGDELSGEDVLPGFTCRVAELFE